MEENEIHPMKKEGWEIVGTMSLWRRWFAIAGAAVTKWIYLSWVKSVRAFQLLWTFSLWD